MQIRQGLSAYRQLGMAMEDPYFLALLAEACASAGQIKEGLAVLADAMALLPSERGFFYAAEIYRLQGEFLLAQADQGSKATAQGPEWAAAAEYFAQALTIARRQEAKSLELRAAMSLGRLWQRQGHTTQARQLLADIYGWFSEGFDTIDLQAARKLLATLS
jgi:predicted ATPase